MNSVAVVTVDDQAVFRSVAREVLEATPGFESAGEAASGEEALRVVDEVQPQLVLVDVRMPGMDGIETARRLHAAHPELVIALISVEEHAGIGRDANAFVRKQDFGPGTLRRLWAEHGH